MTLPKHATSLSSLAVLAATAALLSACGGGGDAESTAASPPPAAAGSEAAVSEPSTSAPATGTSSAPSSGTSSTPATGTSTGGSAAPPATGSSTGTSQAPSVPASGYAAGSEELAAFTLLNTERTRCGFGALAQNAALDLAARGHADWLLLNNYTGHGQVAGTPGFTGASSLDRMVAAGYAARGSFGSGEVEADATGTGLGKSGAGVTRVRGLLNAPYHLLIMMRGYRDVGIGVRDKADVGLSPNNRHVLNIDLGYKSSAGLQAPAAGSLRTYPCEGSSGVDRSLVAESPNPVPGRNLSQQPLGTTVSVVADAGTTLTLSSASMVKASTGAAVNLRQPVTRANDPNGGSYVNANEGFISADAPLEANTAYRVTINGTANGAAFTRTFTFSTGN